MIPHKLIVTHQFEKILHCELTLLVLYNIIQVCWNVIKIIGRLLNLLRQNTVFFRQSDNAIIRFTHTSDFSTQSIILTGVGHPSCLWIDISNAQLDGGMILSGNNAIACRANENLRLILDTF